MAGLDASLSLSFATDVSPPRPSRADSSAVLVSFAKAHRRHESSNDANLPLRKNRIDASEDDSEIWASALCKTLGIPASPLKRPVGASLCIYSCVKR